MQHKTLVEAYLGLKAYLGTKGGGTPSCNWAMTSMCSLPTGAGVSFPRRPCGEPPCSAAVEAHALGGYGERRRQIVLCLPKSWIMPLVQARLGIERWPVQTTPGTRTPFQAPIEHLMRPKCRMPHKAYLLSRPEERA